MFTVLNSNCLHNRRVYRSNSKLEQGKTRKMSLRQYIRLMLTSLIVVDVKSEFRPMVNTTHGPIKGIRQQVGTRTVDVFYGVPYAKPPVGDLRFRRPETVQPWTEVKDADTLPNSCHQVVHHTNFSGLDTWNPATPLNEDCLYLNIWVPSPPAAPDGESQRKRQLPIMVWLHGGGFAVGTSTLDVYDARYLAAHNDVIVVTLNYRLGILGFLFLDTETAPGNMGLLDQQLALRWINENSGNFGGDKNRITIFGWSAGAASVSLHMMSPGSRDLFTNGIMQSGSALADWVIISREEIIENAKNVSKLIGCGDRLDDAMINCLKDQDATTLISKQSLGRDFPVFPFLPIVDAHFLLDTPINLLRRGDIKNTSIIAGFNGDEGTSFLIFKFPKYLKLTNQPNLTRNVFLKVLHTLYGNSNTVQAILFEYEKSIPSPERQSYINILDDVVGDDFNKCPVIHFAQEYSKIGGSVFLYTFDHTMSNSPWPRWAGAMHGYEIETIFGLPLADRSKYTESEKILSSVVTSLWTSLAKNGKPQTNDVTWPGFTDAKGDYLVLDINIRRDKYLRYHQCTFWREMMPLVCAKNHARLDDVRIFGQDLIFYTLIAVMFGLIFVYKFFV